MKDAGTINEYKKLLANLENLKFTFSKKEILEYYFIRFVRVNRLFKNYYKILPSILDNRAFLAMSKNGKKVKDNFSYKSNFNSNWKTSNFLRKWLKKYWGDLQRTEIQSKKRRRRIKRNSKTVE